MAHPVDRKIVELEFDNEQFNKNVRDTITAVKQGKNASILGESAAKSVSNLGSSLRVNAVSMLSGGLESFKSGLVSIGQKATDTIRLLGERALETAKGALQIVKISSTVVGGLAIAGGTKRALNLEHANFQLKGLLKDGKRVEAVMKDVNASVLGTAYGLDEAAVVASQFAASEIKASQEHGLMLEALRGVAGVAAMGGAEYSRVGQIFTTVAGQGRLMGDQLLQLSTMGLNAASTLKDYLNEIENTTSHTEEEIREMVSDGKIDFETFAKAMDWAFGEHATKANETFTGALSNLKAALSRVGAEFATPALEQLRKNFLAVIPVIDTFKNAMKPIFGLYKNITGRATQKAVDFLKPWESFDDEGNRVLPFVDGFTERFEVLAKYLRAIDLQGERVLDTLFDQIDTVFEIKDRLFNDIFTTDSDRYAAFARNLKFVANRLIDAIEYFGSARNQFLEALLVVIEDSFPGVQYLAEMFSPAIRTALLGIVKVRFAPMFSVVNNALSSTMSLASLGGFRDAGNAFSTFILSMQSLTDSELSQAILRFSNNLLQIISFFGNIGTGLIDGVFYLVQGVIEGVVWLAPGELVFAADALGDFKVSVSDANFGAKLERWGTEIGDWFRSLGTRLKGFGDRNPLVDLVNSIESFFDRVKVWTEDSALFAHFSKLCDRFVNDIKKGPKPVPEGFKEHEELLVGWLPRVASMLPHALIDAFKTASEAFKELIGKVGLDFSDLMGIVNSIILFFSAMLSKHLLGDVASDWLSFIEKFKQLDFSGFLSPFTSTDDPLSLASMINVFKAFGVTILTWDKVSQVGKIAMSIFLVIAALYALGSIGEGTAIQGIESIAILVAGMIASLALLSKSIKLLEPKQLFAIAGALMGVGLGVLVLAGAVRLMGAMRLATLLQGLAIIGVVIFGLTTVLRFFSKLGPNVVAAVSSIWIVSVVLGILAVTVALFGHMSLSSLLAGFLSIAAMLIGLVAALELLGATSGLAYSAAGSFVVVSAAMGVLAIALTLLSSMSAGESASGIGYFGAAVAALVVALTCFAVPGIAEGASAMIMVSGAFMALAIALAVLSALSFDALAILFIVFVGALTVLAVVSMAAQPLIPVLFAVAEALFTFGAMAALMGAAMLGLVLLIKFIASHGQTSVVLIANAISMAVSGLIGIIPQTATAIINVLSLALYAIIDTIPGHVSTISSMLSMLLGWLLQNLPMLVLNGGNAIAQILEKVRSAAPQAIQTGALLIQTASLALLESIPWLVTSAANLLLTGMFGAASFIRANHDAVYNAGKDIFLSLLSTIGDALGNFAGGIGNFLSGVKDRIFGESASFEDAGESLGSEVQTDLAAQQTSLSVFSESGGDKIASSMRESAAEQINLVSADTAENASHLVDSLDTQAIGTTFLEKGTAKAKNVSDFKSRGETSTQSVTSGFLLGTQTLASSAGGKVSEVVASVRDKSGSAYSDGYDVGSNFGAGLYRGIDRCIKPIADKAAELVRKNKKKNVDKKQEAGSPSRYTMRFGNDIGTQFDQSVTSALMHTAYVSGYFSSSTPRPFTFISDLRTLNLVPWDDRPAITPVFDLDEQGFKDEVSAFRFTGSIRGIDNAALYNNRIDENRSFEVRLNGNVDNTAITLAFELATLIKAKPIFMEA